MVKKIILILTLLLCLTSSIYSTNYDFVNSNLNQKTLTDLIIDVVHNMNESNSNIYSMDIKRNFDKSKDYTLHFTTNDYMIQNNFTLENSSTYLLGYYSSNNIYIVIDEVLDIISDVNKSVAVEEIKTVLIHELTHYYQDNINGYATDLITAFNMDVTYISGLNFELNNNNDYTFWDIIDIPLYQQDTVNMTKVYSIYPSVSYVTEIQARFISVCYYEKSDYEYYWDMIRYKDYNICQLYTMPSYTDNLLAEDFKLIINKFYGLEYNSLTELENTTTSFFNVITTFVKEFVDIIITILPLAIVLVIMGFIFFIVSLLNKYILVIFKSFKKK